MALGKLLGLVTVLSALGCVGAIGNGEGAPEGEPGTTPGGEGGSAPVATPATSDPRPPPLRPLTPYELSQTIFDLFQDRAPELGALQPSKLKSPSENMVGPETIWSGSRADLLEDALYRIASRIAATLPTESAGTFFARELPRIFRRAVSDGEQAVLVKLVTDLEPKLGRVDALARGLQAAMLSADFLYLTSVGEADGTLSSAELASRLSYFVIASAPDAALREAAARDELRDPKAIERETRRLLADPRSARSVARFVRNWTGEINLASVTRSDAAWTPALASDALGETDAYVSGWFLAEKRPFASLIASDVAYVTPSLARFYGLSVTLSVTGDGLQRVTAPAERVGLFTQASFLATHAVEAASSPTLRGKWFVERGLCQALGSPPANALAMAPEFKPDMQTRDWHEALENTKGCNACHSRMEPPGYVFEGFDGVGRARTTEKGRPVRTTSTLKSGTEMDLAFTGARDFSIAASKSETVRTCFATYWLGHALGRDVDEADAELAKRVGAALRDDAREAIVVITTSSTFRRASR